MRFGLQESGMGTDGNALMVKVWGTIGSNHPHGTNGTGQKWWLLGSGIKQMVALDPCCYSWCCIAWVIARIRIVSMYILYVHIISFACMQEETIYVQDYTYIALYDGCSKNNQTLADCVCMLPAFSM